MQTMGLEHTRVFPLIVLKDITDNFSEERVIGRGGSGVVYKGILHTGEEIAVKKLHNRYDSSGNKLGNGEAQFLNELMNLIGVQHPNIIRLVGYCYETRSIVMECDGKRILTSEEERVLCLEFMQGGSLKDHLSDESCGLEWHIRFNIIKGVCEGLKYLHTGSENPIYHLDLKPENIWLDRNMQPKIGDFGISRLPASSMQTYATENAVSGTIGYMAPEYISWNQISQKCDVYSLGFIMIRVIAGENGPKNYDPHRPLEEFIESVHKNWGKRRKPTMSWHSLQQVKTCTEIALRCVEFDREKRPTITDIVDELKKIDAAGSSAIGDGQNTEEEEHTALEEQADIREQKENNTEHLEGEMEDQVNNRTKINLQTSVTMDLQKAFGVNNAILPPRFRWSGSKEQDLHGDVLHLQSGVQRLKETLPTMYNLIDVAEWKSHENFVALLFPKLKDAVYDADDLLDEFRWHDMKVKLEGNVSETPFMGFMDTVIQGSFNKLNDVQGRLDHLSSQLKKMGIRIVTQRFDKTVRPETSSLPNETKLFARDNELKLVMQSLGVPTNSKRKRATSPDIASTSTSPSNQVSNESRIQSLPVLSIVGIGGVGKTTIAQHICDHEQVKSHFKLIIWICVSDDFEVKRLTKEAIQSCVGNKEISGNLDSLQRGLSDQLKKERFLIVLDDMWDDALKENGQCWERFYAPLEKSAQEGSMMLVTTRCPKVAGRVGTMKPIKLEGLNDGVFWNLFKFYAFGSETSNNDPELERIGRKILPKLKGSPLAAKTLGRMLRTNLRASHWNNIYDSELWELKQEATDILPALRLSYMHLPFYLKRCFSFCAVYPKDYLFVKKDLTEIWLAEGFVESEDIGFQYLQDLVARSFFQEAHGGYVIHDLLHDMAQKVSEHDCFILRNKNDFDKVPKDVRHIYIHSSSDILISNLSSLSKHTKLRTLICKMRLSDNTTNSVLDNWCTKLLHMRVLFCASVHKLPDSIGNLKHLRYLKISETSGWIEFSEDHPLSIPSSFCWLYNLQTFYVQRYKIESLPNGFSNLNSLERFESHGFSYYSGCLIYIDAASEESDGKIGILKNLNQFPGYLKLSNCHMLSKDQAAEVKLKNKKYLYRLQLEWMNLCEENNGTEVLEVLQPPISLRTLLIRHYPGVFLPSWFQPQNLPSLTSVSFEACELLDNISISVISQNINLNEIPAVLVDSNNNNSTFSSLTELTIRGCQNLSNLKHFLHPDYIPAIKKISLRDCNNLLSVPTERFGNFSFLEELDVGGCPNIRSQSVVSPSLKQLKLGDCGSLFDNIDCCSVTNFSISTESGKFIQPQMWRVPALDVLEFQRCSSLTSIGVSVVLCNSKDSIGILPCMTDLTISSCPNLSSLEHFLHPAYLPAIKKLSLQNCKSLVSVPTGRLGDLRFLEELDVDGCPNIRSRSLVSLSLKQLKLGDCGSLLDNIDCCLVTNFIISNNSVTSIQPQMWTLPALQELNFLSCKSLTSIEVSTILALRDNIRAFSKLNSLNIEYCPKLSILDGFLTQEYLPTIERIQVAYCDKLVSLPGESFGSFSSLKHLLVYWCSLLNWQSGLVLPSSLQTLDLEWCGDFSACVPRCLENLSSLVSLKMAGCDGMTSIPGTIWRSNLASLEELVFWDCPNLVSIGGAEAVASIKEVKIFHCPNLREALGISSRGPWSSRRNK